MGHLVFSAIALIGWPYLMWWGLQIWLKAKAIFSLAATQPITAEEERGQLWFIALPFIYIGGGLLFVALGVLSIRSAIKEWRRLHLRTGFEVLPPRN